MNDNIYKNALIILITFRLLPPETSAIMVNLAAGLFILPFFLFAAPAGQLADQREKSQLIRYTKLLELTLALLALIALHSLNPSLLVAVLFLLGAQSSLFGPLKYAILPQHLSAAELLPGNALIEAGTFLAILLGTLIGGYFVSLDQGPYWVALWVLGVASAGYWSSRYIPAAAPQAVAQPLSWHLARDTWQMMRELRQSPLLFWLVMGISWFWMLGATMLTQLPLYSTQILHASELEVTALLALFSIGIGLGSLGCQTLLRGQISLRLVPAAALAMSLALIDLSLASSLWRAGVDLCLLAMAGGVFIVPFYARLQIASPDDTRARMVASNNLQNALFMVLCSLAIMVFYAWGGEVRLLFVVLALANVALVIPLYVLKLSASDHATLD